MPASQSLTPNVRERYEAMVAAGELAADPAQRAVIDKLDALNAALAERRLASKQSPLGWLFGRKQPADPLKGLYIWGSVGRGKTMLMDLFFERAVVTRKRRAHFHEFMSDAHERIHAVRQKIKAGTIKGSDPIAPVAAELAQETRLLCFDEFSVTDIADAMLLGRLFEKLFDAGVVVVATSNVDPDDLYRDGLNRGHFLPFIKLLKSQVEVFNLDSPTDYRLEKLAGAPVYVTPLGEVADREMERIWNALTQEDQAARRSPRGQGALDRGSANGMWRCPLLLSRAVRAALFGRRLPARRPCLPYRHGGARACAAAEQAQRGQAVHQPDRRALRPAHQAGDFRRDGAGRALCRDLGHREIRVRPHDFTPDGDAFAGVSG